jgi:uroporphyrinogen decarboxylase
MFIKGKENIKNCNKINMESIFKDLTNKYTGVWFMRQAGRYLPEYLEMKKKFGSFLDMCYDSDALSEVTLQPIKRFDLDAAIIFSDILVILDALGFDVSFEKDFGPRIKQRFDLKDLKKSDVSFEDERFQSIYLGIKKTRSELDRQKSLIGFVGAPWTLACYACTGRSSKDFHETKKFAYNNEDVFENLIAVLIESCFVHACNQVDAGVNAIQIFDSWSNVLDEEDYHKWVFRPFLELSSLIKAKYPTIPIIWFPRASFGHYEDIMKTHGKNLKKNFDCFGVDYGVSLNSILEVLPENIVFQGNLDPSVLLSEKFENVERKALNILNAVKNRPRIFNLGHGMIPETRIENVSRLIDLIRRFDESLF